MTLEVRVIVVEDHPVILEYISQVISEYDHFKIVATASSGKAFIDQVHYYNPDVVFVDIDFPDGNGIDMLRQIQQEGYRPLAVFMTAHTDYALEAYEVMALDYILKPFDKQRLYRVLARIYELHVREKTFLGALRSGLLDSDRMYIKVGRNIFFIKQHDIIFIKKQKKKTMIITNDNTYIVTETMYEIERRLNNRDFLHTHKSYIVNLRKICQIVVNGTGAYSLHFQETLEKALITRDKVHLIYRALGIPWKNADEHLCGTDKCIEDEIHDDYGDVV